jgi:hypothetical protein
MSEPETDAGAESDASTPVLRIDSTTASPEDVAALTAVFASIGSEEQHETQVSGWVALARKGRYAPRPGPSAWRLSARGR